MEVFLPVLLHTNLNFREVKWPQTTPGVSGPGHSNPHLSDIHTLSYFRFHFLLIDVY